jgi:hypothetical protein
MSGERFRYVFAHCVDFDEVEASLVLARIGVESLHGATVARLDAAHVADPEARAMVIDASNDVGRDLNRLFAGFLSREFGSESFVVDRISGSAPGRQREMVQ